MNKMMQGWNVIKGKEHDAMIAIYWSIFLSILSAVACFLFYTHSITLSVIIFFSSFIVFKYVLLGLKRCYYVKKFRGHFVLRWCCLVAAASYLILGVIFLLKGSDNGLLPYNLLVCLAAIRSVLNGFMDDRKRW